MFYLRRFLFSDPSTTLTRSSILTKERKESPRLEPGTIRAAVACCTDFLCPLELVFFFSKYEANKII